jgi:hypothetical protein
MDLGRTCLLVPPVKAGVVWTNGGDSETARGSSRPASIDSDAPCAGAIGLPRLITGSQDDSRSDFGLWLAFRCLTSASQKVSRRNSVDSPTDPRTLYLFTVFRICRNAWFDACGKATFCRLASSSSMDCTIRLARRARFTARRRLFRLIW